MEPRHLRCSLTVTEELHFARAAKNVNGEEKDTSVAE